MKNIILVAVACVIVIGVVLYLKRPTMIDNYEGTWKPDVGNSTCGFRCGIDCLERFGQYLDINHHPVSPSYEGPVVPWPTEKSIACTKFYCPKPCTEDAVGSRTGYCLDMIQEATNPANTGKPLTIELIRKRLKWANTCFLEPRTIL